MPAHFQHLWKYVFALLYPCLHHLTPHISTPSGNVCLDLVLESKVQPSLSKLGREKRLLFLDHSLRTYSLENIVNGLAEIGEERSRLIRWVAWTALLAFPM
jgi:hypothetical protein